MTRRSRVLRRSVAAAALAALAACGKKGPPLAPIHRAPARITDFAARRTADLVRLTFTAPAKNDDGSDLIDLARVDIYALTVDKPAEAPDGPAFLAKAAVVAIVDGAKPGELTTTGEKVEMPSAPPLEPRGSGAPAPGSTPASSRLYVAVPVSAKRRRGAPSARAVVSLAPAPAPPGGLRAEFDAKAITLDWLPATPAPAGYNIYELVKGVATGRALNASPLKETTYVDPRLTFGVERCYVVRATTAADTAGAIESQDTAAACVTPRDTFPPAAPAGLAAVAGPGVISLIWNASTEPDLAGYLVLRGEAPGERLHMLTPAPIRETTYRDDSVKAGVRYVYAIVAVDSATPPNVSPQSARVEETAR